jgi:hypothetical protein
MPTKPPKTAENKGKKPTSDLTIKRSNSFIFFLLGQNRHMGLHHNQIAVKEKELVFFTTGTIDHHPLPLATLFLGKYQHPLVNKKPKILVYNTK